MPVALIFPGQGSQYVKMLDGVKDVPEARLGLGIKVQGLGSKPEARNPEDSKPQNLEP